MIKLSVGAELAWYIAALEAFVMKHRYIEREQILIGICSFEKADKRYANKIGLNEQSWEMLQTEQAILENLMNGCGLDTAQLRHEVRDRVGQGDYEHSETTVHRSKQCKKTFKRATDLVESSKKVSSFHLLAAVLEDCGEIIGRVFEESNVDIDELRQQAISLAVMMKEPRGEPAPGVTPVQRITESGTPYLDRFGRDLTREARESRLGPFIGRRKELLQIIQTLAHRTKNNPVLVGEAGVGKTTIVEALALRIDQGKDPHILADKRIIELNIGALLGGSKYRGEFEERLTRIIDEARSHPELIVFIDEIHNVIGAGRAEGGPDAANLIKPALARGDFRCIGATTTTEYRRYIESDSALERRFRKVTVNESSRDETLDILKGIRSKWEEHYQVRITDRALEVAVDLSIRFDVDHQLPDKAIDLIDQTGAHARIPYLSMRQDGTWGNRDDEREYGGISSYTEVTEMTVAQVLSEKIGVPLEIISSHMEMMTQSHIMEIKSALKERVIGQNEAIERLCERLLIAHTGLGERRGPLAVFLFLGPTGVGKTYLAQSLAVLLFGTESDMIRLDMSEYMEKHSIAKLIGSPPGYVGYGEEGYLTGKLRSRPYSIVLLDEIEKAHPRIFDLFLQVFDEGRLTDSKGRTVDTRHAIFIMTSNIPADKQIGFCYEDTSESKSTVLNEVKKRFRREFLNRIDEQIVFRPLGMDEIKIILRYMLEEIRQSLLDKYGKDLHISEKAVEVIANEGYSDEYGVRHLRRSMQNLVEAPLSRLLMSGEVENWQNVEVDVQEKHIVIKAGSASTR
jgi:ATP-dependent Clp protease ATP-binding subunit ClpC